MKRLLLLLSTAAAATLGACSGRSAPSTADDAAARAWVAQDQAPLRAPVTGTWYAAGKPGFLICGEIDTAERPLRGGKRLRFVYDKVRRYGQVEIHAGWVTRSSTSQRMMGINRTMFDDLWQSLCSGG